MQRNLADAESHSSDPQLSQENNILIIRTFSLFVSPQTKSDFWLDYPFLDNSVCLYITRMPNLFLDLYGTTKLFLKLMCPKPPFMGKKIKENPGWREFKN